MADAVPVEIVVTAEAECMTDDAFWSALAARTARVARGRGGDVCEVRASKQGPSGASGAIVIVRGGLRSEPRTIEGATCREVLEGLALVAALAWDRPEAWSAPAATTPATEEPEPPSPEVPSRGPGWTLAVGLKSGISGAGTDGVPFAWGGFVDVERSGVGLAPAFRLGLAHAESGATTTGARVDLAWTPVRASACPLAWESGRWLRVGTCATFDVGVLHASSPQGTTSATRPWLAAGLSVGASVRPTPRFFLEIAPFLAFPLVRDDIALEPVMVYRAPLAVAGMEIGAGLRFP